MLIKNREVTPSKEWSDGILGKCVPPTGPLVACYCLSQSLCICPNCSELPCQKIGSLHSIQWNYNQFYIINNQSYWITYHHIYLHSCYLSGGTAGWPVFLSPTKLVRRSLWEGSSAGERVATGGLLEWPPAIWLSKGYHRGTLHGQSLCFPIISFGGLPSAAAIRIPRKRTINGDNSSPGSEV